MASLGQRDATYFDQWYADMSASPARDALWCRSLGLPPDLLSNGNVTWQGIGEVSLALALSPDDLLLDLACGRGGYGIEVARRTGARLLGVDFSAVALEQAMSSSMRLLGNDRSQFRRGALGATGLPAGSVDGAMCLDAVQFAQPPLAALLECFRVLAPGGRLVLTSWEAVDPDDERVGPRIQAVHLRRDLPAAGFVDVEVRDMTEWRAAELGAWQEVVRAPAGGDAAVESLQAEGRRSLAASDSLRRVFATASTPAH